jgi:anti-sigma B factor antagonist
LLPDGILRSYNICNRRAGQGARGKELKATVTRQGEFPVVAIEGKVVRENQQELRTLLEQLVSGGARGIALNLEGVEYMDSAGLGCCAAVRKLISNNGGGSMAVFGACQNIKKMWGLIRLDLIIPTFPDAEAALAYLSEYK